MSPEQVKTSMGEKVKVFGYWASPYSHRVELALRLKGVPYEHIEEDVFGNKSPLLLQYNPIHKKVPVLLHKGKPIIESLLILEYTEETWNTNPILPQDPYDKATARFWTKFIDDKCFPALWKALWGPESKREKAIEEACECLKTLENTLNGNKFFGGDEIGMVDIGANFIGFWLRIIQEVTGVELLSAERFPDLFKWSDEYVTCSVVKDSLPSRQELLAFFEARAAQIMEYQSKASK